MVSIQKQMVAYLGISIAIYLFALLIATILKVFLNIQFTSYGGEEVDIVTYIIFGAIDLFLELVSIGLMIIFVVFIWIWNGIFVGFIFKIPILDQIFGSLEAVSEDRISELSAGLNQMRDLLGSSLFQPLRYTSSVFTGVTEGASGVVGGIGDFLTPIYVQITLYAYNFYQTSVIGTIDALVEGVVDAGDQIVEGVTDGINTFQQGIENGADAFEYGMNEAAEAMDEGDIIGGVVNTGAAVVQGAGNVVAGTAVAGVEVGVGVVEAGIEVGQGVVEAGACFISGFFGGKC